MIKDNTFTLKKILFLAFFCWLCMPALLSQSEGAKKLAISGFIKDSESGEVIIGAVLAVKNETTVTLTDKDGYFTLYVHANDSVQVSSFGYQSLVLSQFSDTLLQISLRRKSHSIGAVTVTADLMQRELHKTSLGIDFIESLPNMIGKPDVLKAMALMPGISLQSEVSSALIVRGGNPGDNLFLLDNIPIHYVYHLGGFFSVFNSDMINKVEMYKSGFPPLYGGKLSAFIDVQQKKGNTSEIKGNMSVGISDISFSVDGPIGKKSSFIVTGRKSMIDYIYMGITAFAPENNFTFYGLHDINAKYSWSPNTRNTLDINLYYGDDYFTSFNKDSYLSQRTGTTWGNVLLSAAWKNVVSSKLFSTTSLSFSRYRFNTINNVKQKPEPINKNDFLINDDYELYGEVDGSEFLTPGVIDHDYKNQVSLLELLLSNDWKYHIFPKWNMDFGVKTSWIQHNPVKIIEDINKQKIEHPSITQNGANIALYMNHNFPLLSWFEMQIGARFNSYIIDNNALLSFEPRVSFNFPIQKNHLIGVNYTRMAQNTHLLFINGDIFNNQIWFSSNDVIPTALSDQIDLSWRGYFHKQMFEVEAGLYYKYMSKLTMLKDGYNSIFNHPQWENTLATNGKGEAYGAEFSIKKLIGKWTGMVSYTYSRSFRQFGDVNDGKKMIYDFDRPHNVNIAINRKINNKWTVSLVWTYQSGTPYTPIKERVLVSNIDVGNPYANTVTNEFYEMFIYGERNSARMKAYHRLDLGAQYNYITKKGRKACWSFSIYNVYNRANSAYFYYNETGKPSFREPIYDPKYSDFKQLSTYSISYFPIMPMVSYKLWFNKKTERNIREQNKQDRADKKASRELQRETIKNSDRETRMRNLWRYD